MILEGLPPIVWVLFPLVLIELGIRVYAIMDILKPDRVTNIMNKTPWIIICALINFGWVIYLLVGRKDVIIDD